MDSNQLSLREVSASSRNSICCRRYPGYRALSVVAILFLLANSLTLSSAVGQKVYDPEHPDVKAMIQAGLRYLIANDADSFRESILFGTAAYKAEHYSSTSAEARKHPLVVAAEEYVARVFAGTRLSSRNDFTSNYAPALTLIFLLDMDAEEYRPQIQQLLDIILTNQQQSGAWGYISSPNNGDTSQMQYIGLALWLASKADFDVAPKVGKDALNWMIDNQGSGGGWIYTIPPMTGDNHANEERLSLAAAGSGTVYVLAEWLQLASRQSAESRKARQMAELAADFDLRLPPSVTEYDPKSGEEILGKAKIAFDMAKLRQSMARSNAYFNSNFKPNPEKWPYYFLYAFERYASLREFVDGDVSREWEDWYDQGVVFLKNAQRPNGSWPTAAYGENDRVSTALAILFLTRSMQQSISRTVTGVLVGNQGFGDGNLRERKGGRISADKVQKDMDMLINHLAGNPDEDLLEQIEAQINSMDFSSAESSRTAQLAKFREMLREKNGDVRLIAVKAIARSRSMDNVPALIFALTDPDPEVGRAANDGLRFISRKVQPFDISLEPDPAEMKELKKKWIDWYLSIKPDGRLIEEPGSDEE